MLYPYRPSSVKNRQRFNFGVLYPQILQRSADWFGRLEHADGVPGRGRCLSAVEVRVRFLKLVARSVRKLTDLAQSSGWNARFELCSPLEVDGKVFAPWQEAIECEVTVPACNLDALTATPLRVEFRFSRERRNGIPA